MNEVWHARSGIVARGRARSRIRSWRRGPARRHMAASGRATCTQHQGLKGLSPVSCDFLGATSMIVVYERFTS